MNITYLFGAGASRGALPIVNEMPDRIEVFLKEFDKIIYILTSEFYFQLEPQISKRQVQLGFIENLKWLQKECRNHASIDTFAKKLYLKDKFDELTRLKATLSAYLTFEQALNFSGDKRYDAFFASILNKDVYTLPDNIKILSWNYDIQFEKAYSEYIDDERMYTNQSKLNVVSKYRKTSQLDKFGIYKINGTTGLYNKTIRRENNISDNILKSFNSSVIESVLKNYHISISYSNIQSSLSFAWEDGDEQNGIITQSIEATKDTDVLIVIGYSFPFFNREIDRKIISAMGKLEKVYFQSPDADNIKERFLSVRNNIKSDKLISRFNVDQFFLPDEL